MGEQAEIIDRDNFDEIIAQIRNENNPTNWILITYEGPRSKKLKVCGSGEGGVDEMIQMFKPEGIFFGLVRDFDQIDDSILTKFAFVEWLGDKSPRLQKAGVGMQLGAIQNCFGQFHVTHMCSDLDDISAEIIMKKFKNASGSAVHVLD